MERRYIGIDFDGSVVRVAILEQEKQAIIALDQRPYGTPEELTAALREMIGDTRLFGDRLAVAMPAVDTFVRWLKFPFSDPRKIESALAFELSAQLPVPVEQLTSDFQAPLPEEGGGCRTAAAAVRTTTLEELLASFDGADIPVHVVDVAPFAFARGLREQVKDGLLACVGSRETTLALMRDGRVVDFRLIPGDLGQEAPQVLLREGAGLQREAGVRNLPLYLIGAGATKEVAEELTRSGRRVEHPRFYSGGRDIDPEYLPAVALAVRASVPGKEREFNFRRGQYALKNEWSALKREVIAASVVLLLTLLTVGGTAYLSYAHKASRLEAIDQEIAQIFRKTFPGERATADIPAQMQSRIKQLRERARLIGSGPQGSALTVLDEISRRTPKDVTLDVRDLNFTADGVRMEGVTTSFDAINQIARSLQDSSLFTEAQISDAKMSLDGKQVDFRLNLTFEKKG